VNELCDKCPSRFELLAGRQLMVYLESVLLWHPHLRFIHAFTFWLWLVKSEPLICIGP